jgi:hypothetical protein
VRFAGGTAAVFTVAVILGGCGSKYTRADFRARANAICATAVRQARSLTPPVLAGAREEQMKSLSAYMSQLVPVVETESTQLLKLKTPPGTAREQTALKRYLATVSQVAAQYRQLEVSARHGDREGVASALAALRASPVTTLAVANGLRSCGNPSGTVA